MSAVGYIVILIICLLAHFSNRAAYSNGVCDGYGYSREPRNPGYAHAGVILKKMCGHRFRELRDAIVVGITEDIDCCPSTGEKNCAKCSGEYCNTHHARPCECDVGKRHFGDFVNRNR